MHSSCLPFIIFCLFFERPNEKSYPKQFKTKGWGRSSLSSLLAFTGTLTTWTTLHFNRMLCLRAVLTTFYVLETHSGLSASGNMTPFPWHQGLSSGRQTSSHAFFVAGSNYQAAKPAFQAWPQYLTPTPKSSNHLMARRRVAGDPAFNTKHTLILLYGYLHRVGSGNVNKHQVPAVRLSVALVQRAIRRSSVINDDLTCNGSILKKTNKLKICNIIFRNT